jgi:hypothetical protein
MFRPRPLCPKSGNALRMLFLQSQDQSCLNEPRCLRRAFVFHFIILKIREVLQAYSRRICF